MSNSGPDAASGPADSTPETSTPAQTASEEGLPEWEPLTPELVEDEAIRGDFMLRWAAILLAILLGWTEITETATLVRLRTGEYLAGHNWLPPGTDVFSYTATDRPWLNFSWLSDLALWGLYRVGQDVALSIVTAILAGISFGCIVYTGRQNVSTWWGSTCAVLALVAAFPLLRPGPDSITILGLAVTMLLLARSEERPDWRGIWAIPAILWMWSNLDGHAFLGLALVAAYALGRSIGGAEDETGPDAGRLWGVAGASLAAMLVHPFHWQVLRAPLLAYGVEYPELRIYSGAETVFPNLWIPLTEPDFWERPDVFSVAGLIMAGISFLAMVLNRNRLRWSHAIVWLVMNGLAVGAGRQLAAVSVVNAVLAALNGQDWYRASFRQNYSVETAELLFSRGGRAVTVLAFFALAYLAISGRLMGADGRRIGFGFDADIASVIRSFESVVKESYDDRPFNFLPEQGDALIWVGQKPFIDSRMALYAAAEPNLAELHRDLRPALRQPDALDSRRGRPEVWRDAFDQYQVTHVLPRLAGAAPDYLTFFDLLTDPEQRWALTHLDASTAAFYYRRPGDQPLADFIAAHVGTDFVGQAFRQGDRPLTAEGNSTQPVWPRETTSYDRLLMLREPSVPNDIRMAQHYVEMLRRLWTARAPDDYLMALAILTIRHARRGLSEDPNTARGYLALAGAYRYLYQLERAISPGASEELRLQQLLGALHQALVCNPQDAGVHFSLFQALRDARKFDLALQHLQEVQRLSGALSNLPPDHPQFQVEVEQNREFLTQVSPQLENMRNELQTLLDGGTAPRSQIAQAAYMQGLPGEALRLLEADLTIMAQDPPSQLLYAGLLLDVGRAEEALSNLQELREMLRSPQAPITMSSQWRRLSAIASVVVGDYDRALPFLEEEAAAQTRFRLQTLVGVNPQLGNVASMSTAPLTHGPQAVIDARPLYRSRAVADALITYPVQWSSTQFMRALCCLELGSNELAQTLLRQILELDPESELRTSVVFYTTITTGERVRIEPPSDSIPVWDGMFAPDEPAADPAAAAPATDAS